MKIKVFFLSFILFLSFFSQQTSAQVVVRGTTDQSSADDTYLTLSDAFKAIGTSQPGRDIVVKIIGSTVEPFYGITIGDGDWNSLKIYPTVSGVTITNVVSSSPLIYFKGADNVTIDGRVNQTGPADMIIDKVSLDGVSLIWQTSGGAGYSSEPLVTISAPLIPGGITATATAIISKGTVSGYVITNPGSGYGTTSPTVTLTGGGFTTAAVPKASLALSNTITFDKNAEGNTIQYCKLRGNSIANSAIIWFGSGLTGNSYGNGNNTIQNNIFSGNESGRPLFCIVSAGTSSFPTIGNKILNNEFKDFLLQHGSANQTPMGIYISGSNLTPSPNNAWTICGNSFYDTGLVPKDATVFAAIQLGGSGQPAGTGYIISDNYIGGSAKECAGSAWSKSNDFNNAFSAISLNLAEGLPTNSIQNNTIKNFSWSNSANAIWNGIAVQSGDVNIGTINGNTIGDNTSAGSINYIAGTNGANVNGIYLNNSTGTIDCQNNKIGSIILGNNLVSGTTAFNGIFKAAKAGTTTINKNTIGSTTIASSINSTNAVANQNVTGILCSGTGSNTVSGNIIANLTNATTTGAIQGVQIASGTNSVNGNFICCLSTPNSTSANMYGLNISSSTGTYSNNIISLGDNYLNTIYGIYETGLTGSNNNVYFNTVHLSGNPTSGTLKSYCLYSAVITNTRDFKNNIFSNVRSNASGTNIHYPMWIQTVGGNLICDNNDYFKSGTGGTIGYYGGNKTALPIVTDNDANSKTDNPEFANAGGVSVEDYKTSSIVSLPAVTGTGILVDFANNSRNNPPKMGAYETCKSTKVNNTEATNIFIKHNATGVEVILNENSTIELYTISGILLEKIKTSGTYSRKLNDGIYIIRINGKLMKFVK